MINCSFIIPSYNSFKTLGKTLDSILHLEGVEFIKEIIIVDSSNDKETRVLLQSYAHSIIKIISLEEKTSPALGRNIGAKHATGELLCFIDSDVYLERTWLTEIIKAYASGCRVGCGSVSIPDFQQHNNLALAQLYLQFNESLNAGETRPTSMVPACNMFVDKVFFNKAGGFPNIRASEDVLLCLKLGEMTQVWFVPSAKCYHIFRESFQSYFNNQIVLGKYIIIYRRQMYKKWFYKGYWPLLLLPAFLIIKSTRIKLRIFKAGWHHTQRYIISSPLFAVGLYYWAVGFVQGCLSKEE